MSWRGQRRQTHGEYAAAASASGRRLHRAAVKLDEPANEGEANAESGPPLTPPLHPLHEQVEDSRQQLRLNPDPVVLYRHDDVGAIVLDPNRDRSARRRVLHGVAEQVHDHLLDAVGIRIDPRGLDVHGQIVAIQLTRRRQDFDGASDDVGQVNR